MNKKIELYELKNNIQEDGILKERFTMNNRQKATNHKKIYRNLGEIQKGQHKNKL